MKDLFLDRHLVPLEPISWQRVILHNCTNVVDIEQLSDTKVANGAVNQVNAHTDGEDRWPHPE